MIEAVILAAGKGTRMRSAKPKVLHTLAGKPFVKHVIDTATQLDLANIHLVVGHGAEHVQQTLGTEDIHYVEQAQQLGTGHAVAQALPNMNSEAIALILYGDVPLIALETLRELCAQVSATAMALLTVNLSDPMGYGRIVRDNSGKVSAIVEQKDASPEQLMITEVNTGVMAVKVKHLHQWLPKLSDNNAQGEYYLTDIIAMAVSDGVDIATSQPQVESEVLGVNSRVQQAKLERIYQRQMAETLLDSGVALADPARFDCRGSLTTGNDCFIDINCLFEGDVVLGNNVQIGANCTIRQTQIADNTIIKENSVIENAILAQACVIGPFARLRPGTELADHCKIGNFVETKNAKLSEGSKVNHLSYVGDAVVGRDVNIGAGTITCNYDGANKHQTEIGDRAFVGSNTALVAPVVVEAGATIAAGSTITKNVAADSLALTRAPQKSISTWVRPVKKHKK